MTEEVTIERSRRETVTHLRARCGVRYWEDATINGHEDADGSRIPCREGEDWCPVIELATGRVLGWPEDTVAKIHYKVCDDGTYELLRDTAVIVRIDGYVPGLMSPGGDGFGDYVIMTVGGDGVIEDWDVELEEFAKNGS